MRVHYASQLTLKDAITEYFAFNKFGPDGGYSDKWVRLKLGPISLYIPNTAARVRAVRIHDLHHVATGYRTDWIGEFEISAWELATWCGRYHAAWVLNLGGLVAGLFSSPRRTVAAFMRGRRSHNLYAEEYGPALLTQTVGQVRARLGLHDDDPAAAPAHQTSGRWSDWLLLALYVAMGVPVGLLSFVASVVVFVPLALLQQLFFKPTAATGST